MRPLPTRAASLLIGAATVLAGIVLTPPAHATSTAPLARKSAVNRHLSDGRIVESSGLARSTYARPLLWTHNDSGDSARVFAVGRDGTTRAVLRLRGADAVDWEDISTGPDHTVWVGDIGDNGWDRDHVTVYRFREPRSLKSGAGRATAYDFTYPDGPRDAEALLVRPDNGRVFIVSKDDNGGAVYRAPRRLSTSTVNKLQRVTDAPATVTGGTFAPDGKSLVLVNYTRAYTYAGIGGAAQSDTSKVNNSAQGESVEISRDGRRMFLGQEGSDSPVYAVPYSAP